MSLELALQQATAAFQQNTAAMEKLIKLLETGTPPAIEQPDAPAETPKVKRTKKEAQPEAPAGEPAPEQSAPSPASGATDAQEMEAAAAPAETKVVTYTEAAAAVTALASKKGRDAAVALLAEFGAKTLKEVKASSYAAVVDAANARL